MSSSAKIKYFPWAFSKAAFRLFATPMVGSSIIFLSGETG
jgi:hypothetical protein